MKSTLRRTTLIAALAATLVPASTAIAKGGGGGGGGSCAKIDGLTVDATATGRALDAVVTMDCVDEHSGAVAFDYLNPDTGVTFGRSVIMSNLGTRTYSVPLSDSATRTVITVTVYAPNGKVQDTRSITV